MIRNAKRTNTIYFGQNDSLTFVELPEGYFYKGKFYTESQCFTALLKDKEIIIHSFQNGTWSFKNQLYASLLELYEWNEDEIAMSYKDLKACYQKLGIIHNPVNCTMYSYDRDEWNQLFSSRTEVLLEIRSETNLIEDVEEKEERYLDKKTKEECIAYFKKPIKERIKILEESYHE